MVILSRKPELLLKVLVVYWVCVFVYWGWWSQITYILNHSQAPISPSVSMLTAEQLAELFFDKWYCKNGLPLEILSDRDKLSMSQFWTALHKLTGVKLKMLTSYHLEMDGSSEQTNKTVIQCIHYAVERDQVGWVKALLKIRFDIMNVVLSTAHWRCEFRAGNPNCIAKFMACFDGLFLIKSTDMKHSTVTLDLPNLPNIFPVFHTLEVWAFTENNDGLFLSKALIPPEPVNINSHQEFCINKIVDEKKHGKKTLYQVCWQGEGPEGNLWLPSKELTNCKALEMWMKRKSTHPPVSHIHSYVNSPRLASSFSPLGFWCTHAEYPIFLSFTTLSLLFSPFYFLSFIGEKGVNTLPIGPHITTFGTPITL